MFSHDFPMMTAQSLNPAYKPIQSYNAALDQFAKPDITHETAVGAFRRVAGAFARGSINGHS